jgi:acylaminoacyl-peptidase
MAAVLAVCSVESTSAQSPGRALAIEDYYRVLEVGAPQMSPDGRWVAFTVSRRIEATNSDSSEVWVAPAGGSVAPSLGSPRRVSAAATHATAPQWSAEGGLRFTVGGRLWLANPDATDTLVDAGPAGGAGRGGRGGGGGDARLTSPDGRWTVVVRATRPTPREAEARSEFERRHDERFQGVQFDWLNFQRDGAPFPAPDAADVFVSPPQEIVVTPASGGAETQLTRLGLRPNGTNWNATATALTFTADSQYRNERRYGADQVWTVSTEGIARRLTTDADHDHTGAQFSPDGRWILSTHQLSTDDVIARKLNHGGPTDLVVISASGEAERNLTSNWDFLPAGPRWSPDGRFVYFTSGVGGTTHLFRVSAAGGEVEQVTRGERRIDHCPPIVPSKMAFTVGRIKVRLRFTSRTSMAATSVSSLACTSRSRRRRRWAAPNESGTRAKTARSSKDGLSRRTVISPARGLIPWS